MIQMVQVIEMDTFQFLKRLEIILRLLPQYTPHAGIEPGIQQTENTHGSAAPV